MHSQNSIVEETGQSSLQREMTLYYATKTELSDLKSELTDKINKHYQWAMGILGAIIVAACAVIGILINKLA